MRYLAIGWQCWARGETEAGAIRILRRSFRHKDATKNILIYECEDDNAYVTEDGCIASSCDAARPRLVKRIYGKKTEVVDGQND